MLPAISCDNYLDLRPQDGIVREEFWKTKEDIQAAVIGIYSSLLKSPPVVRVPTGGTDYNISEYLFMYGEFRGDMVVAGWLMLQQIKEILRTSNILSSNDLTSWACILQNYQLL